MIYCNQQQKIDILRYLYYNMPRRENDKGGNNEKKVGRTQH